MFVLGIDAGGTKTVCHAADGDGRLIGSTRGAGANLISLGEHGVEIVLRDLIADALRDRKELPAAVCLGMAGVDQPREADIVRGILERIGLDTRVLIVNDSLIALEAGAPGSPGVVIASGTGSIVYGRDADGHAARAGGWGHLLADEGSGFSIGREALRAVVRAGDRRGPQTSLTARVLAHYGVDRPQAVPREVYNGGVKPAAIATLAFDVQAAADAGDAVAMRIIDDAAADLAPLAQTVVERLALPHGPIVLAGGTFRSVSRMTSAMTRELAARVPGAVVRVLEVEPAEGAVHLALALARGPVRVPVYVW